MTTARGLRRLALLGVATALVLAGCGEDTDDEPQATTDLPGQLEAVDGGVDVPGDAPAETDEASEDVPDGNIVGGEDVVDISDFPWVAALRQPGANDNGCGGALVQSDMVMTAAHCVTQRGTTTIVAPSGLEVVLGRENLNDKSKGDVIPVKGIYVAKAWDPAGFSNDFAVLLLERDAVAAQPIALGRPGQGLDTVGQRVLTLGWGCESGLPLGELCGERPGNSPLKLALLDVQPEAPCTAYYEAPLPESVLCMQSKDDSAAFCQGDSGGPWAVYVGNKPHLIGVTSFNHRDSECGPQHPQGVAKVALTVAPDGWFTQGIWNYCEGTRPCPFP